DLHERIRQQGELTPATAPPCPPPQAGEGNGEGTGAGFQRAPFRRLILLAWDEEVAGLRTRELVSGAAAGVVGGYVGTKVMNPVTTKLYEVAPEADKAREKAVSPGSPYRIGAPNAA